MLLYAIIIAQGAFGYGLTSVMGPIPAEIFEGRHFGSIFGTVMVAVILGSAAGPWITGVLYPATGPTQSRSGSRPDVICSQLWRSGSPRPASKGGGRTSLHAGRQLGLRPPDFVAR